MVCTSVVPVMMGPSAFCSVVVRLDFGICFAFSTSAASVEDSRLQRMHPSKELELAAGAGRRGTSGPTRSSRGRYRHDLWESYESFGRSRERSSNGFQGGPDRDRERLHRFLQHTKRVWISLGQAQQAPGQAQGKHVLLSPYRRRLAGVAPAATATSASHFALANHGYLPPMIRDTQTPMVNNAYQVAVGARQGTAASLYMAKTVRRAVADQCWKLNDCVDRFCQSMKRRMDGSQPRNNPPAGHTEPVPHRSSQSHRRSLSAAPASDSHTVQQMAKRGIMHHAQTRRSDPWVRKAKRIRPGVRAPDSPSEWLPSGPTVKHAFHWASLTATTSGTHLALASSGHLPSVQGAAQHAQLYAAHGLAASLLMSSAVHRAVKGGVNRVRECVGRLCGRPREEVQGKAKASEALQASSSGTQAQGDTSRGGNRRGKKGQRGGRSKQRRSLGVSEEPQDVRMVKRAKGKIRESTMEPLTTRFAPAKRYNARRARRLRDRANMTRLPTEIQPANWDRARGVAVGAALLTNTHTALAYHGYLPAVDTLPMLLGVAAAHTALATAFTSSTVHGAISRGYKGITGCIGRLCQAAKNRLGVGARKEDASDTSESSTSADEASTSDETSASAGGASTSAPRRRSR